MSKTVATFTIEFTKKDLGRLPGSTRPSHAMRPKKGKGSYRRDKKINQDE